MYLQYILNLEYYFYNKLHTYNYNEILVFSLVNKECYELVNEYNILNKALYRDVIKEYNNIFIEEIDKITHLINKNELEEIKEQDKRYLLNLKDLIFYNPTTKKYKYDKSNLHIYLQLYNIYFLREQYIIRCIIKYKFKQNRTLRGLIKIILDDPKLKDNYYDLCYSMLKIKSKFYRNRYIEEDHPTIIDKFKATILFKFNYIYPLFNLKPIYY